MESVWLAKALIQRRGRSKRTIQFHNKFEGACRRRSVSIPPGLRAIKTIGLPLLARARALVTRIFPYYTLTAFQFSDGRRVLAGGLTDLLCEYRASRVILFLAAPSFNVS